MSDLGEQYTRVTGKILASNDKDGLLKMMEAGNGRYGEKIYHATEQLKEEDNWPTAEIEDRQVTVREGDEIVCTAEIGGARRMGGPRARTPSYTTQLNFDDECSAFHRNFVEYEFERRSGPGR